VPNHELVVFVHIRPIPAESSLQIEYPRICFYRNSFSSNMSKMGASTSESYDHAIKLEESNGNGQLERLRTEGGHLDDRTQPSLPVVHRSFANPAPLGLLSFATGILHTQKLNVLMLIPSQAYF